MHGGLLDSGNYGAVDEHLRERNTSAATRSTRRLGTKPLMPRVRAWTFRCAMRRASQFIALLLPLVHSLQLPRCTIAVAGANGRVGSMVCRELLRNHPQVTVRALVRRPPTLTKATVGCRTRLARRKARWTLHRRGVSATAAASPSR